MPSHGPTKPDLSIKSVISAPIGDRNELFALEALLAGQPPFLLVSPNGNSESLPQAVVEVLRRCVKVLAQGEAVCLMPVDSVLTTQQAADILNVSRQYMVRLLDGGELHFTKTGKHRRVRLVDLLGYKKMRDGKRRGDLRTLTRITQAAGGYPELD